jgi:drug/metabolite transporter (DMT)-like permease
MKYNQNISAAVLAIGASAILSFIDNFVAEISDEAGLWQFQLTRTLMALPLLYFGARVLKVRILPTNIKLWGIRSIIVSAGLLMYFATLGFLPVTQAAAGLFSAPIWVLVFSATLFSQRLGTWQILATLGGFAGVLMVLKIDPRSITVLTSLPLTAGAFYGLGMMITRHWCASESPAALAFGIFLTMGVFSILPLTYFTFWPLNGEASLFIMRGYQPVSQTFYWLTLLQAVGAVIAVSLISQAYRIGDPTYVAVFEYSFLIFAAFWTFLLWNRGIEINSAIGIALIIVCGSVIAITGGKRKS